MKKLFILLVLLAVIFMSLGYASYKKIVPDERHIKSVKIEGHEFQVELANTPEKRASGLGNREGLCEDCGMLFIFPDEEDHAFWMKDMKFNIDILWISRYNDVVYIKRNATPESFPEKFQPPVLADKVLEIRGGLTSEYDINVGDKVSFGF